VLIDANLLVLYFVGSTNKSRILTFKRTQVYTVEDFELLERSIAYLGKVITTPHILTEVSNLASLRGQELVVFRKLFQSAIDGMKEFCDASREVVSDGSFQRLGLTDAAIARISRHNHLVLTDDLTLEITLHRRGVDAVNFNHIRAANWTH
jgi:hypothetical protein